MIKQISVFLENTAGRLKEVTETLAAAGINLRAVTIADTTEFGILRLIVNDHEKALNALTDNGFTTRITDVAAIEVSDTPGSLAKIMELFGKSKVNIEYLYSSLEGQNGKAVIIFKLDDIEKGLQIIRENKLSTIDKF